jgi:hypothetical protein
MDDGMEALRAAGLQWDEPAMREAFNLLGQHVAAKLLEVLTQPDGTCADTSRPRRMWWFHRAALERVWREIADDPEALRWIWDSCGPLILEAARREASPFPGAGAGIFDGPLSMAD